MNDTTLVQKVWNYAHVLRDQGVLVCYDVKAEK